MDQQHPQASLRPASSSSYSSPSASSSFRLRSQSLNTLRLRRVFDLFDGNGDGEITAEELTLALNRLGLDADAADLGSTVSAYVKPGLRGLEFDDFQKLHTSLGEALFGDGGGGPAAAGDDDDHVEPQEEMVESDLTEAFKVFDEDGDGFISADELQAVLGKLGLPEGREIGRVKDMICSVDRNDDGRVDFDEFKYMMQTLVAIQGAC